MAKYRTNPNFEVIKRTWIEQTENIVVDAVAGSGKTTLLMTLLELADNKTLFLAFNKSIQEEIAQKIENRGLLQGKALTLHSLGLQSLFAYYRKTKTLKIENNKSYIFNVQFMKKYERNFRDFTWEDKLRTLYTLQDLYEVARIFNTFDYFEIVEEAVGMGKMLFLSNDNMKDFFEEYLEFQLEQYEHKTVLIDFLDMIFLPVYKDIPLALEPIYLFIDEAQDLNLIQHKMIEKFNTVKRFVAVGDFRQSIYGFSGAYSNSIEKFIQKPNTLSLPLNLCYRCPVNIVAEANKVYDVMTSAHSDEKSGIVKEIKDYEKIKNNSLVICRNVKPLLELYFKLLQDERIVFIKGKDILKSMKRFLSPYKSYLCSRALQEMENRKRELIEEKNDKAVYLLNEKIENFVLLTDKLMVTSVKALLFKIDALFEKKDEAIILSTIHKSKGLGENIVYILNENLIPSPYATTPEQLQQEKNLKYVARTRAKKELYYLNLEF